MNAFMYLAVKDTAFAAACVYLIMQDYHLWASAFMVLILTTSQIELRKAIK